MKTLVLGIGNPILSDDGVGVRAAQELAKLIADDDEIAVDDASTGGLNLLDFIAGYERVIIIDAIMTEGGEPGAIYRLTPENFATSVHLGTSMHDVNFPTVIEMGKKFMPEEMPREIVIFAIEVEVTDEFTEEMTTKVKGAVPEVVNLILGELGKK